MLIYKLPNGDSQVCLQDTEQNSDDTADYSKNKKQVKRSAVICGYFSNKLSKFREKFSQTVAACQYNNRYKKDNSAEQRPYKGYDGLHYDMLVYCDREREHQVAFVAHQVFVETVYDKYRCDYKNSGAGKSIDQHKQALKTGPKAVIGD